LSRDQHINKRDTKKKPLETGDRNGASIAKFRSQRQSHIREMPRYRAVLSDFRLLTRRDGRQDSNLCISKSDLLNFIVAQPDLGRLTPETLLRSAARVHQFEMRKFESCALG
jgi:hypothetical protein